MGSFWRLRGRYRSLQFLLNAFLVGCLSNGAAMTLEDALEARAEAEAALKEKGTIEKKKYPPGDGFVVKLTGASITDEDIEHLKALDCVAELDLSGSTVTDDQLASLVAAGPNGACQIPLLFRIDLSNTKVTDAGLKELETLGLLAHINVKGATVSDAGVQNFIAQRGAKKLPFGLKLKVEK